MGGMPGAPGGGATASRPPMGGAPAGGMGGGAPSGGMGGGGMGGMPGIPPGMENMMAGMNP